MTIFAQPRAIERVDDCYFYHTMELPGFGVVQGHWDLRGKFEDYVGHVDFTGKSVLDIGAASGFLSFEAERHGASGVVSFDMSDVRLQTFVPFPNKRGRYSPTAWAADYSVWIEKWKNAYWLCHRLFNSRAQVFYGDVVNLPAQLGRFDVAIVGSILEHLRDPAGAIESVANLTQETLVIVTPVVESDERVARFEPRTSKAEQDYTWWTWSTGLYREFLGILGFRVDRITTKEYWHEHEQCYEPRTTLVATRKT